MDNRTTHSYDDPGLEGPDYVSLVIEWDEIADNLEDEITTRNQAPHVAPQVATPIARSPRNWGPIAAGLGAVGAVLLGRWAIHHLRAA